MNQPPFEARWERVLEESRSHGREPEPWFREAMLHLRPAQGERCLLLGGARHEHVALLCELAGSVRIASAGLEELARLSAQLKTWDYANFSLLKSRPDSGDYTRAPFDLIYCESAAPYVAPAWLDQLAVDGRLICPVGTPAQAQVVLYRSDESRAYHAENLFEGRFPPLA